MTGAVRLSGSLRSDVVAGALAGIVGGVAFGLAWLELGVLPSIATLVRAEGDVAGLIVHLGIAVIVGIGLALLVRGPRSAGDTVLWGVTYAAFFWFLGPMTLQAVILGETPSWDVASAQAGFASLLGHILYGAAAALALAVIRRGQVRGRLGSPGPASASSDSPAASSDSPADSSDSPAAQPTSPADSSTSPSAQPTSPSASAAAVSPAPVPRTSAPVSATSPSAPPTSARVSATSPSAPPNSVPVPPAIGRGLVLRGLIAGGAGFVLVSLVPLGQERMVSTSSLGDVEGTFALGPLLIALVFGALYSLAHPVAAPTAGASVVRGAGFGFILWVLGGLTLLPLLRGEGLAWSVPDARMAFAALIGSVLFGAATGLVFHWLTRLTPILFSDDDPDAPPDGGSWGLRAVVRGAAAGLVGALLFTLVMVRIGFLPAVASLVGSDSELVGLVVHLLIGATIGATYGLFFRRQAFDAGAAVGWGVAYGFVWWLLGPLTLAPMIAGAAPAWSVDAAAVAFPGLIGHLAYGAGLGLAFYLLEARYTPWWISRSERELERMAGRRRAATSAGPALWALLVLVAVLLPTVLAAPTDGDPTDPYGMSSDVTDPYGQDAPE